MIHTLTSYQQDALRYTKNRLRIALFLEMRLGKSVVAIRWLKRVKAQRILLVAPLTTLLGSLNWQGELTREGVTPVLLSLLAKEKRIDALYPSRLVRATPENIKWSHRQIVAVTPRMPMYRLTRSWAHGWFGINYEALRTQPEILDAPWDAIILDESTRIRSPKAQITKTLLQRTSHIKHRAILTGLPNPENPLDYFCQFVFLHGTFMGFSNFWSFRHALFYTGWTEWDWMPKPKTRDRIKAYVHEHAFVLTRKQAGVGSTKVRRQRSVELNAAQRRVMKEMRTKFEVDGVETKWTTVVHTWMQRVAGGFHPTSLELISDAKIRLTESLIMEDFRKEPVVIWFRFNEEIRHVRRWLKKRQRQLTVEVVHGAVHKRERPKIQERFQDGTTQVLLMQVKLGRYGWNLSRSSTAIYYSNSYEFEDRSQSEDRIIHLTKKKACLYLDLVTLGTPDEDVVAALSSKRLNARLYNNALQSSVVRHVP